MKRKRRILRTAAMLATSLAAFGAKGATAENKGAFSKKARATLDRSYSGGSVPTGSGAVPPPPPKLPGSTPPLASTVTPPKPTTSPTTSQFPSALTGSLGAPLRDTLTVLPGERFPWRHNIVTTTFWIGEDAAKNNPVPNYASSWDPLWAKKYGGLDTPDRKKRADYIPANFVPGQNPFYIALPYNDITKNGHKAEAASVIPWFKKEYKGAHRSVLKGRWVAIKYKDRVAYAQWEDCGPFRTDHWQYVFGNERPKPNLNKGAGLDVSPAVRDYLGMNDTDVTSWKFVDFEEVPAGPWAIHGENNTFVQLKRAAQTPLVMTDRSTTIPPLPGQLAVPSPPRVQ